MMMRSWITSTFMLGASVLSGCFVASGGEQSPLFEGEGLTFSEDGGGRVVSVDTSTVPQIEGCMENEIVRKTATGWECAVPDSSFETDPNVNALAKVALEACENGDSPIFDGTNWGCAPTLPFNCGVGEAPRFDGSLWSCGAAVSTAEFETLTAASALISAQQAALTALETRVSTLEEQVLDLRFPIYFADDFERASLNPDGPLIPESTSYESISPDLQISSGALTKSAATIGEHYASVLVSSTIPTNTTRMRMAFTQGAVNFENFVAVSINDCMGGSCGMEFRVFGDRAQVRESGGGPIDTFWVTSLTVGTDYFVTIEETTGNNFRFEVCELDYDCAAPTQSAVVVLAGGGAAGGSGYVRVGVASDMIGPNYSLDEVRVEAIRP